MSERGTKQGRFAGRRGRRLPYYAVVVMCIAGVLLAGCTLQAGVERTPAPDLGLRATTEALATDNARLAAQVATLSAVAATTPAAVRTLTGTPPAVPPTATVTAAPTATPAPSPTPVPAGPPTPLPAPARTVRVTFAAGSASTTFKVQLSPGITQAYVLAINGGQRLYISTVGEAVAQIWDTSSRPLTPAVDQPGHWELPIPTTADYTVVLLGNGSVSVTIYVPPR